MPFASLAIGLGGGLLSGIGSAIGGGQQAKQEKNALNFQKQQWADTQRNLAPFIGQGGNAVANLSAGIGTPQNPGAWTKPFDWLTIAENPAFQFIEGQGEQAIVDQKSATGGIGGGNTLKALMQFGQGNAATFGNELFDQWLATQQNAFNQNFNLANLSEAAAAGQGNMGVNTGANIADTMAGLGNAQAAGTVGLTNGVTSGLNNVMQNYMLSQLLNGGGGFG